MAQQPHDVALEPDEFRLGDEIGMPRPMKSIACWKRQRSKMTLRFASSCSRIIIGIGGVLLG
jgi:hypothetical protein